MYYVLYLQIHKNKNYIAFAILCVHYRSSAQGIKTYLRIKSWSVT